MAPHIALGVVVDVVPHTPGAAVDHTEQGAHSHVEGEIDSGLQGEGVHRTGPAADTELVVVGCHTVHAAVHAAVHIEVGGLHTWVADAAGVVGVENHIAD